VYKNLFKIDYFTQKHHIADTILTNIPIIIVGSM